MSRLALAIALTLQLLQISLGFRECDFEVRSLYLIRDDSSLCMRSKRFLGRVAHLCVRGREHVVVMRLMLLACMVMVLLLVQLLRSFPLVLRRLSVGDSRECRQVKEERVREWIDTGRSPRRGRMRSHSLLHHRLAMEARVEIDPLVESALPVLDDASRRIDGIERLRGRGGGGGVRGSVGRRRLVRDRVECLLLRTRQYLSHDGRMTVDTAEVERGGEFRRSQTSDAVRLKQLARKNRQTKKDKSTGEQ